MNTQVQPRSGVVTWAGLAVVAGAAAVLSFATVRDLADSAGYPPNLGWLLPVVIDATAVVGSRIWLAGIGCPGAIRYARALALAAAAVTIGANVLQHGLTAYHQTPPWWLVAALAAIPPTALVAVAHQVALLTRTHSPDTPEPGEHSADPARQTTAPSAGPGTTSVAALPLGDDELEKRARQLVATSERPLGRRRLARELEISEHHARVLLSQVSEAARAARDRSDASPTSPADCSPTPLPALNGASHV